ncbi:MAG: hypothetical protein J6M60_04815 [Clostridia bacterium]|nr:hypothetical protein [Clostridia bacterium]
MEFTEEQRKRIDALLAESDEEQKRNGNKTYTHEEAWKPVIDLLEEMKKREKENVRN